MYHQTHLVSVILVYHIGIHLAAGEVNVDICSIHGSDAFSQCRRVLNVLDTLVELFLHSKDEHHSNKEARQTSKVVLQELCYDKKCSSASVQRRRDLFC